MLHPRALCKRVDFYRLINKNRYRHPSPDSPIIGLASLVTPSQHLPAMRIHNEIRKSAVICIAANTHLQSSHDIIPSHNTHTINNLEKILLHLT